MVATHHADKMEYNPFTLSGKTVLVTGASSGIGRATAIECSKAGATLILSARNEQRLKDTFADLQPDKSNAIVIADLTEESSIESFVNGLPELDGAVLCAGKVITCLAQFCDREHFDEIFDINFFSNANLLRLLYKKKKLKKGASVVIIASIGGISAYTYGNAIYGSSKAALNSFAKYCANEFSQRLVRVNCICPGMIDTPLIHHGTISDEQHAENAKRYPLKRYGKPTDVAYAALYLLSDAAEWVTGSSLVVDGGITIK